LSLLCDALSTRLKRIDHYYVVQGCTVKVRYHDFTIRTSDGPAGPIRASSFAPLLTSLWERRSDPIRLLGIGCASATKPLAINGIYLRMKSIKPCYTSIVNAK